jgi:hypothetical protein
LRRFQCRSEKVPSLIGPLHFTAWLKALTAFGNVPVLMPLAAVMLLWLLLNALSTRRGVASYRCRLLCRFDRGPQDLLLRVSACTRYAWPERPHEPQHLVYGAMTLLTATANWS